MASKCHLALYGGEVLVRDWCPDCEQDALILDGCFACCGEPHETRPERKKRMSGTDGKRFLPVTIKREIRAKQDDCCIYCGKSFGAFVRRGDKHLRLQCHYDHALPYAYVNETKGHNIVAACHVCNGLKSDRVFETLEDAALWLAGARERKGYDF